MSKSIKLLMILALCLGVTACAGTETEPETVEEAPIEEVAVEATVEEAAVEEVAVEAPVEEAAVEEVAEATTQGALCSPSDEGARVEMKIENKGPFTVSIYWMGHDCQSVEVAVLEPDEEHLETTTVGHVFTAGGHGYDHGTYVVPEGGGTWTITGPTDYADEEGVSEADEAPPCGDGVACQNGGTCVSGTCDCPDGYQGADCSTAVNAKFSGLTQLQEDCTSGPDRYALSIALPSGNPLEILVTGLWDEPTTTVAAKIDASNGTDFVIEKQAYTSDRWSIEGNGSIDAAGTKMTISYRIYEGDGPVTDSCQATITGP